MPDALPAVTVPVGRTIGFSLESASIVVSGRGCSSAVTTAGGPFFCGTVTGTISSASDAVRLSGARALLTSERELVLIRARDAMFGGDVLRGLGHRVDAESSTRSAD